MEYYVATQIHKYSDMQQSAYILAIHHSVCEDYIWLHIFLIKLKIVCVHNLRNTDRYCKRTWKGKQGHNEYRIQDDGTSGGGKQGVGQENHMAICRLLPNSHFSFGMSGPWILTT